MKLKDVRPVVVTNRVKEAASSVHGTEVDLGDQDRLLMAGRSRQDCTVGVDDHAVAGLDPLAVGVGSPELLPIGKVRWNLVDMQAGVDPDDVTATLPGNVGHGRDPAVAACQCGSGPDLHTLRI